MDGRENAFDAAACSSTSIDKIDSIARLSYSRFEMRFIVIERERRERERERRRRGLSSLLIPT